MQPPDDERRRLREQRTAADLDRLLSALAPLPPASEHPALVMLVGLPGTGKSTFSRALADRFPAAIVESDAVRKILFPQPSYSPTEHYIVFQRGYALADALLKQGISVIFDATNLVEKNRKSLYRIAESRGARLAIILTEAPETVIRQRLQRRQDHPDGNSDAGWDVYERMITTMEHIRREHVVIDTTQDIGPAVERLARALRQP